MNAPVLTPRAPDDRLGTIIKLAIMAVGGQGGGVLTNWVESMARAQGYHCQATSVAGVSQRTGATIYYIEMSPPGARAPIFSLAPAAGDVDVLVAAEMMEAGRAILRGFVTPDRTTLIASTHRALAVSEKTVPGDGIAESAEVMAAAEIAADQVIAFDMEAVALAKGSVISSALFGALAGAGVLPFERAAFEDAIRASGRGVEASLASFAAAFERAQKPVEAEHAPIRFKPASPTGSRAQRQAWQELIARVDGLPAGVQEMARPGLRKVVGFQDTAYGADYLNRLDQFLALDGEMSGWELSQTAAKYLANAMAYDDVIRVADLKTRRARFDRIADQMQADSKPVHLTEFFHPRAEEIAGMMPARMGGWFEAKPTRMAWLDRRFNRGRRIRTHRISGFLGLYLLGGLRRFRRRTLRHRHETAHLDRWMTHCLGAVAEDYEFAVELLRCRRLIKGYSDTHARGLSKFDRVIEAAERVRGRKDAAEWVARLSEAGLQDEAGIALDGAIETVRSFTNP